MPAHSGFHRSQECAIFFMDKIGLKKRMNKRTPMNKVNGILHEAKMGEKLSFVPFAFESV
jgi:hypothetical protein